jgi:hypothetical protein
VNRKNIWAALLTAAVVIPSTAFADDLHPPPWLRGLPNSTSQEWVFNTPNLGVPDGAINGLPAPGWWNPNGTPFMTDAVQSNWLPAAAGRTGVWSIFPGGILQFMIPNTPESHTRTKEIWAQITWASASPTGVVSLVPFGPPGSTVETIGVITLGGGWFHSTFHYILPFNPEREFYQIINNSDSKLYVDQVVLDTICVPEPATMAGLGFGLLLIARRMRRSRK